MRSRRTKKRSGLTNIFGIMTLVVIIMAFLLHFSNLNQQEQILYSYCGNFGFYGKQLTLRKDHTFLFRYHGCSQSSGYLSGKWSIEGDYLTLNPDEAKDLLDKKYLLAHRKLFSIKNTDDIEFVLCEN